jgi:hypothetical protein
MWGVSRILKNLSKNYANVFLGEEGGHECTASELPFQVDFGNETIIGWFAQPHFSLKTIEKL